MSERNDTAGIEPLVSRNDFYVAFARALRIYVGRQARYSYKELQRRSGVAARMIEAYKQEPGSEDWRAANIDHILSLSKAIGPEFTADWLRLANQGAFWLPDDETPPGELAADNAEDNATLTRAAIDNQFNADERPDLKVVGARMMNRGAALVAIGSKAA